MTGNEIVDVRAFKAGSKDIQRKAWINFKSNQIELKTLEHIPSKILECLKKINNYWNGDEETDSEKGKKKEEWKSK